MASFRSPAAEPCRTNTVGSSRSRATPSRVPRCEKNPAAASETFNAKTGLPQRARIVRPPGLAASRVAMLPLSMLPLWLLSFSGVTGRPGSFKSPRQGVLGRLGLLPQGKPAAQLGWMGDILKIKAAPFSQRKETVLRYRIAQQRAEVEKLSNEISALEARNEVLAQRPGRPCASEEEANSLRITTLRRDAGVLEARIIQLKLRLNRTS